MDINLTQSTHLSLAPSESPKQASFEIEPSTYEKTDVKKKRHFFSKLFRKSKSKSSVNDSKKNIKAEHVVSPFIPLKDVQEPENAVSTAEKSLSKPTSFKAGAIGVIALVKMEKHSETSRFSPHANNESSHDKILTEKSFCLADLEANEQPFSPRFIKEEISSEDANKE